LIALPGFSFFRAPARWSVATALALALLAGKGWDRCRDWPATGRSLTGLALLASVWIGLVLGLVELTLWSASTKGSPWLAGVFQRAFQARPWSGDPGLLSVLSDARKPATDPRIPVALGRAGIASRPRDPRSFMERRSEIYGAELGETGVVLAGIVAVGLLGRTRGGRAILPASLLLLTFLDLMLLGRHRLVDVAPLRPLVEQSPVLARLANEPRGTRIVDSFGNLSMLVGLEPISAYRTLDLPALGPLTALARGPLGPSPYRASVLTALKAAGVGVRVLDPTENAGERALDGPGGNLVESPPIEDPALARWMFGPSWAEQQGAWSSRFRIIRPKAEPRRAWFIPLTAVSEPAMLDVWAGGPGPLLELFDRASPLRAEWRSSEHLEVAVDADATGWVIVTQLADPQWKGRWTGRDRQAEVSAEIRSTFRREESGGGWQRVEVPGPGRWTLHLDYVANDVANGLLVSAGAWVVWITLLAWAAFRSRGWRGIKWPVTWEWRSSGHPAMRRAS
jgi:hypothetical protein